MADCEDSVSSLETTVTKLSEEPGFTVIDIGNVSSVGIPPRSAGLLVFLYVDRDLERVVRILMLNDIAMGFLSNRLYSGCANRIAYIVYPEVGDCDVLVALAKRLRLFAQLTEKYDAPQTTLWVEGRIGNSAPQTG